MGNDEEFLKKLLDTFKVEANDRLQKIVNNLLDLEKAKNKERETNLIEQLYREIHSLKSGARAVNLTEIEKICQTIEDKIALYKKNKIKPTADEFARLYQEHDVILALVQGKGPSVKKEPSVKEDSNVRVSTDKLNSILTQAEEMLGVKINFTQRLLDMQDLKNDLTTIKKGWDSLTVLGKSSEKIPKKAQELLKILESQNKKVQTKMDQLFNKLDNNIQTFGGSVENLLEQSKKMMLWPFSSILNTLPRMVRDLSLEQQKEINLTLQGSEVEIDKRILEEMKDVFIHLIRNAVDHGIESPEKRKSLNKPIQGQITIQIKNMTGNAIQVEVEDDGGGIDLEAIKTSAIESGQFAKEAIKNLSDEEACLLIFQSGISSRKQATDLSGRGLGMSIIREKIDKVGGLISVYSKPSKGTKLILQLPLTLATFKGILVRLNDKPFIFPVANLERIIRIPKKEIKSVENKEIIIYSGEPTALVRLPELLQLSKQKGSDSDDSLHQLAVVLSDVENRIAFTVDEVLNEQEILVKNFSKPLIRVRNIAAAAILDTGEPIPILNSLDLLQLQSFISLPKINPSSKERAPANKKILLAEDSITTRMVLKNILELAGYIVTTAVDGLEAWEKLKQNDYVLLVSDIEMPRMTGFELTQKVRADKKLSKLPIVLVTSRAETEDKEKGLELGANAYLVKNTFDPNELVDIVSRLS